MKKHIFECKRCGHCCHGKATVSVSEKEQIEIAKYLGISLEELINKYLIPRNGYTQMKITDGHCIFYGDDGLCKIHPVKPFHCRRWPLHPSILSDEGAWMAIKSDCPGFLKDASYEEVKDFVRKSLDEFK